MAESINCKYEKEFDDILSNIEHMKDYYNLKPNTPEFGVATELEILTGALYNYKHDGCERDRAKKRKERGRDQHNDHDDDMSVGGLFGFNSRKSRRAKHAKSRRAKHSKSRVKRAKSRRVKHSKSRRAKHAKSRRAKRAKSRVKRAKSRSVKQQKSRKGRARRTVKDVLNRKILLDETPGAIKKKLSVTLKKNKYAGTGLFATKPIKRGKTIAYYKMKVHEDSNKKSYKSPTKCMYCFTVYTKNDNISNHLMGDLDKESAPQPKNNIPYWAYFSNEPSGKQKENAEIDIALKENYKNRRHLKDGDFITYKLKATRNIAPGEEVTWCYGDAYGRDYKTNCGYKSDK